MISLRQLAKLCKVSATTVSRSLRDDPLISEETRQRVKDLAKKNNYLPNHLVRGLFTGRTRIVAIIVGNADADPIIKRITRTSELLRAKGYATLLFISQHDPKVETECLHMAVGMRVSGMLISTVNYTASETHYIELRRERVPFILMSEFSPTVAVPHIHGNDRFIAREAVRHLVGLGHRRIAHLGGPKSTFEHSLRLAGIRDGLAEANLTLEAAWLHETDWHRLSARQATAGMLASSLRPTAMICATDEIAVGAMDAIHAAGLKIPDDVSVVGMGNFSLSDALTPPLTTIAISVEDVAAKSVEMICSMMNADPDQPLDRAMLDVSIPCELIVRGSTGRARV